MALPEKNNSKKSAPPDFKMKLKNMGFFQRNREINLVIKQTKELEVFTAALEKNLNAFGERLMGLSSHLI